jgi:hypothetical protein
MIRKIARHLYRTVKFPLSYALNKVRYRKTYAFVSAWTKTHMQKADSFDFHAYKSKVQQFIESMRVSSTDKIRYRYSLTCNTPTLYSSAYACLTLSLIGDLKKLDDETRRGWLAYFDSFQRKEDGLFYDAAVKNEYFNDSDWWGARHLALHMINAYSSLGSRPKYPFSFLKQYYEPDSLIKWLSANDDKFVGNMDHDFDNKLMNISCLLQYQRDTWNDTQAGDAIRTIQEFLLKKINPATGIWGDSNVQDPVLRSRKVQFAYHLFPLFVYDGINGFDHKTIADVVLQTQNSFGGYAPSPNSSACEDIDSIDILIRFSNKSHSETRIRESLTKALPWVLCNQMDDGGFVFKINESFFYGHEQMSSPKNTGAVFPTWFRTLSLAYLCMHLGIKNEFNIVKCPGYEF